jgi:molybdopterin-containing oxidoreductase family membrane subunit
VTLAGRTVTINGRRLPLDPRAVATVAVAEIRAMPVALRAWIGVLLAVAGLAAVAALIALPPGWEVFGTTPTFEWGLLIVGYVFFAITTSGLCLASSLGTVFGIDRFRPLEKRHAILAVLSLTAAFGIIVLDLHYPVRLVLGAVLSPAPSSPMWWMGVFYGAYLCVLLVEVWSMFWNRPVIHQWACAGAACMAVVAPFTLGAVFGALAARPFWHGAFTPVFMVASAFLAGTSLLAVVFAIVSRLRLAGFERSERLAVPGLRLLLGIGLLAVAALVARHMIAGLGGDERGLREATEAVLRGPLALSFWGVRVGIGIVIPALLLLLPFARTSGWLGIAGGCVLAGVFVDRLLFVSGGEIAPITTSAGVVSQGLSSYTPSLVEIGIIIGAVAYVALGYTLAERYLDLRESEVHVGLLRGQLAARGRPALRAATRSAGRARLAVLGVASLASRGLRSALLAMRATIHAIRATVRGARAAIVARRSSSDDQPGDGDAPEDGGSGPPAPNGTQ